MPALKAVDDYQTEVRFHFPNEHRPAGRNAKTTSLTPLLAQEGAHFTPINGWERAEFFDPNGQVQITSSFEFDESFDLVGEEVAAVQNNVGLTEVNGFNRIEITGRDAEAFLDRMICGRMPRKHGRVALAYLLNEHGMIKTEATLTRLPASERGPDRYWYGSAAAAEFHDMDWLRHNIRPSEDVHLRSLTNDQTILVLAGPKARDVISAASRGDWSKEAFPWLSSRECDIGFSPATVLGVSFSGELA
jgi:dimethylglycine dehydrogenase